MYQQGNSHDVNVWIGSFKMLIPGPLNFMTADPLMALIYVLALEYEY